MKFTEKKKVRSPKRTGPSFEKRMTYVCDEGMEYKDWEETSDITFTLGFFSDRPGSKEKT